MATRKLAPLTAEELEATEEAIATAARLARRTSDRLAQTLLEQGTSVLLGRRQTTEMLIEHPAMTKTLAAMLRHMGGLNELAQTLSVGIETQADRKRLEAEMRAKASA